MSIEVYSDIFAVGDVEFSIELTADDRGLTACRLEEKPVRINRGLTNPHLKKAADQIKQYFAGEPVKFSVRLAPDGTRFQREVWKATASIPQGELRSYLWLAHQVGSPKAVRAVAQALGANPLLLFVPCHRIIRSNGELGGFSCGLAWKVLLLGHEGVSPGQQELSLATH